MKKMCALIVVLIMVTLGTTAPATTWYLTDKIQDGDFATDPLSSGWVFEQGKMVYPSNGNPEPGVTLYSEKSGDVQSLLYQDVTGLTSGVLYKVAGDTDFWGETPRAGDVSVWLMVYDMSGNLLNEARRWGGNGWITLETEFTAPANGNVRVKITGQNYWWETQAYWDNVALFTSVPEPATVGLLTLGTLVGIRRRK